MLFEVFADLIFHGTFAKFNFLFYIAFVECSPILVFSLCYVHASVKLFLLNNNCYFNAHNYAFWLCVPFS